MCNITKLNKGIYLIKPKEENIVICILLLTEDMSFVAYTGCHHVLIHLGYSKDATELLICVHSCIPVHNNC